MSKKEKRRMIACIAYAAVALWCWSACLQGVLELSKMAQAVGLRYEGAALSPQTLDSIALRAAEEQAAPPVWAAWALHGQQTASNEEMHKSTDFMLLAVYGEAALIIPRAHWLSGHAPAMGDYDSVAVDALCAYDLWGSTDVVGKVVRYGENEYYVSGVYRYPERTIMMQSVGETKEAPLYSAMEIALAGEMNASGKAKKFVQAYGLGTPQVIIDQGGNAGALSILALLPAWLLLVSLVWRWLDAAGRYEGHEGRRVHRVLLIAGGLGIAAIGIWTLRPSVGLPASALPTRWSDFEFWAAQWQAFTGNINAFWLLPHEELDIWRQQKSLQIMLLCLAALLCLALAMRKKLAPHDGFGLLCRIVGGFIIVFASALVLGQAPAKLLWFCWPSYLFLCYVLEFINRAQPIEK